jgi:hypothetical protein
MDSFKGIKYKGTSNINPLLVKKQTSWKKLPLIKLSIASSSEK